MELTEVKQSKSNENIEHIEPAELKDKKQVYSQAHFVRIKTGENESKLSLKIGRYKKTKWYESYLKTGVPEVKEPKSELTLDNEELDKLVEEYFNKIQQYSDVVVMVQGEFVFTYRMIVLLKKQGIRVVAAQSERKSIEFVDVNKNTRSESVFEFIRFMEY